MLKIKSDKLAEESWSSPKGKFAGASKSVSEALGRKPQSTDLNERHPFDVEILRIPPGKVPYPYHSHSAQWEFYHVISGRGAVRHQDGTAPIEAGDAFVFKPGEPHQLINDSSRDLVLYVVEMLVFSAADFEDFLEPRPDLPASLEGELKEIVALLAANKWPFRLHATYDESITRFLNVFEEVNRDVPFRGLHWFFDHCETISDRNLERVKALGGGIAIQHRMAYQGEFFMDRYGKKAAQRTPPVRKMLELGIPVGAGTDATRVASYNPWVSLYWLVTGKTVGGVSMYPDKNCLSREEALRLYTQGSSWFSNESGKKGAITVGQLADFVALKDDYFSVPEENIKAIESVLTIVGGKIVHATEEFSPHAPPPTPVLPEWSPVKVFGGYGAPLDVLKAARAGVPAEYHHSVECRQDGRAHAADQFLAGIEAARSRYAGFFGSGCDCFVF